MFQWPLEKISNGEYLNNPSIFGLSLIFFSMFPIYILWTLLGVLWVTISDDNSIIRFHYLYKTIESTSIDIDGYYKTTDKTKISSYKGLFIIFKSGKLIKISEYNLKSIQGVMAFLRMHKIPFRGDKNS
jgi:hypothetical protein